MESLYAETLWGDSGVFKVEILVGGEKLPDLDQKPIQMAALEAIAKVRSEVLAAKIAVDPKEKEKAIQERTNIISLFPDPIFVEEILNGYCSQYCCRHLPWFKVTTKVGRFEIGWRKRVIQIDWTETRGTKTTKDLFPDENVTKSERSIHAWGLLNAKRYIAKVLDTAVIEG